MSYSYLPHFVRIPEKFMSNVYFLYVIFLLASLCENSRKKRVKYYHLLYFILSLTSLCENSRKIHVKCYFSHLLYVIFSLASLCENSRKIYVKCLSPTVQRIAVLPQRVLCTKWPKLTVLFYYLKRLASSSPQHPTLPLTGALK